MLSRRLAFRDLYDFEDWSCDVYVYNGIRLPTEAEWEYTDRWEDGRNFPWGNDQPNPTLANYDGNIGHITDRGAYSPIGDNSLGICDLAGNVDEWCNEFYSITYYNSCPDENPEGPTTGSKKVIRGGNYTSFPEMLRASNRNFFTPSDTDRKKGFRIVKILP